MLRVLRTGYRIFKSSDPVLITGTQINFPHSGPGLTRTNFQRFDLVLPEPYVEFLPEFEPDLTEYFENMFIIETFMHSFPKYPLLERLMNN